MAIGMKPNTIPGIMGTRGVIPQAAPDQRVAANAPDQRGIPQVLPAAPVQADVVAQPLPMGQQSPPRYPGAQTAFAPPRTTSLPAQAADIAQTRSQRPMRPGAPVMPKMMGQTRVSSTGLPAQPSMPTGRPPALKPPRLG